MQFVNFDLAYLQRLSAGDPDTERHFVAYFGELLGIKLRARVRTPYLVEEIRQEVFLRTFRLIRRPDGIRQPERLGPLVNSICDNVVLEYRRAGEREPMPLEPSYDQKDDSVNVETEMLSMESSSAVRHVLETLPEREQLLLRAVYFDDKQREQVCREHGVEREYLRVLLHRARLTFKDKYLEVTNK
ncbi:MAG TPA: sigma-70 family RNA polymerase sigma factor [Bryobacteraceae bacterium]|nr:sigma-70 family RNA polymerase sigma factor [Bryobacteraceae bacterium]